MTVAAVPMYDPLLDKSYRATTFDLYGHLDTQDVLADLAIIEGRG